MRVYHKNVAILILLYTFVGSYSHGDAGNGPILETKQGTIRGIFLTSRSGRRISAFLKIPFAEPPIGKLRLKAPVAASNWSGVRDGTEDGPECPQKKNGAIAGNEDCLHLNVYVPEHSADKQLLPVMIFIYGGAFISGECSSAKYGPQFLLDKDVVLVIPNYRIGRLGFLTLEDTVVPGNWGMKDQVMAMKWVQKYIRDYGGDPDSVTLFGESSGAVSNSFHLIVPASKGLFHRVITQSGSALNCAAVGHPGQLRKKSRFFIKNIGCLRPTSEEILQCLQTLSMDQFFLNVFSEAYNEFVNLPFSRGIVREPKDTENAFLVSNPYELIRLSSDIPWINGINSAEGCLLSGPMFSFGRIMIPFFEAFYWYFFPLLLSYTYTANEVNSAEISRKVYDYYFHRSFITFSFDNFTQMISDRGWQQPMVNELLLYNGPKYVYFNDYIFTVKTYASDFGTQEVNGAAHSDELIGLFYCKDNHNENLTDSDLQVSKNMVNFWTNFAIYGDPNGATDTPIWKAMSTSNVEYLYISRKGSLKMESQLNNDAVKFWNNFKLIEDF